MIVRPSHRVLRLDHRALGAVLALSALLLLAGCNSNGGEPRLSVDDYVDVYVELLEAADAAPDSFAAADSARRILAARDLTQDDLLGFARRHTDDPRVLADAWRRIYERLTAPEPADTATADTAAASDSTPARSGIR